MTDFANPPQSVLKVGDVVRLKAGGEPMTIAEVRAGCDGTSHDGAGLRCQWFEGCLSGMFGVTLHEGWLSESSVEKVS